MNVQRSLLLQYHDLGGLEEGAEPPTAPQTVHCSGCVFTAVCVHVGWVNLLTCTRTPVHNRHILRKMVARIKFLIVSSLNLKYNLMRCDFQPITFLDCSGLISCICI